ncbi:F-box domain-containing protein [Colletotrichum karsti]|uniref:F-box domain-containing protein n=1 Tax=Colletotrichum karsti TaxID=1095194 RepID=A0A9P6LCS5_9PEZI|nr:F-box domain-containing protein [Colletotrichum karsti]KAF9869549.1 F-box domain-containing protein [Colletotrichum karsti]
MASAESCDKAALAAPPKLCFLDLPPETQKGIFSHCCQSDLICLALVSKHFRELAAAQLYRNFHIVFPDEDDPAFDSPIDSLAGGLETFVSSDYNYAQHLRDISLDTLSAGEKAEAAYKPYLYSASCGKFMNTLLLLTLKNAKSLETFRWNIRVELGRPVYQALHRIAPLKNLHIRMQAGPSLFEIPPPLPYTSNLPPPTTQGHWDSLPTFAAVPPPFPNMSLPVPPPYNPTLGPPPPLPPALKPAPRSKRRTSAANEPATLSGFRKLNTLAVLDIDNLDTVAEIKSCVRNSASTLTKLKLSFSSYLAAQARKPPPDADPDDSDPDDEFQVVPMSSAPGWDEASGPAKAFRAQEERKSQESVLGRIFDVEPFLTKKSPQRKSLKGKEKMPVVPAVAEAGTPAEAFMNQLREVSRKMALVTLDAEDGAMKEVLDLIEKASRKYLEDPEAAQGREEVKATEASAGEGSSTAPPAPAATTTDGQPLAESSEAVAVVNDSTRPKPAIGTDANPEDINVEEPIAVEETDEPTDLKTDQSQEDSSIVLETKPNQASAKEEEAESSTKSRALANLATQRANFENLVSQLQHLLTEATNTREELNKMRDDTDHSDLEAVRLKDKQLQGLHRDIENVRAELNATETEIRDAEKQLHGVATTAHNEDERISEYIRSTRGLALRSFSIHLIPVKASVLRAAIDVRALKRLTLLNVGNQAPIWTMLSKENKVQPLPLRKIFTDNVSTTFLQFAGQLDRIDELFMLERSAKYKPESFAPKTNVVMDQIRRLVLKKHMPTITKLMIKNDCGSFWDVDEKAMLLICNRGRKLEELAAAVGIRAVHTFMQHISGLVNLRALNVTQFRNDDTCVWVMRETRRFIVDNLCHYPDLKLEWISIDDDRVERIIRPPPQTPAAKKEEKKNKKGKAKAYTGSHTDAFPPLPMPGWNGWTTDSDSSDDEDTDIVANTKLETVEGVHFYDVWDVRIFKKEVMAGRL